MATSDEPTGGDAAPARTRVRLVRGGPMLIDGPVEIELDDGSVVTSDRFVVALCTCKRSKTYPLCDTSHRAKRRVPQSSDD